MEPCGALGVKVGVPGTEPYVERLEFDRYNWLPLSRNGLSTSCSWSWKDALGLQEAQSRSCLHIFRPQSKYCAHEFRSILLVIQKGMDPIQGLK